MYQPLSQSGYLNGKYFFTTFIQCSSLRNKRMRFKSTGKIEFFTIDVFCRNTYRRFRRTISMASGKSSINTTFRTQMFYIYFTDYNLLLKRKTFIGSQQRTILINQSITCKHNISSRFSKTARTEYIPGNATGWLLADERTEIVMFTYTFIISRQIEQNLCSLQC